MLVLVDQGVLCHEKGVCGWHAKHRWMVVGVVVGGFIGRFEEDMSVRRNMPRVGGSIVVVARFIWSLTKVHTPCHLWVCCQIVNCGVYLCRCCCCARRMIGSWFWWPQGPDGGVDIGGIVVVLHFGEDMASSQRR